MRKSRFTERQISYALKQAQTRTPIAGVIRKMGSTGQTFYRFNKQYGELGFGELRGLRLLEEGSRKLKQLTLPLVGREIGLA